jgi:AcrR family transcriptional regulator
MREPVETRQRIREGARDEFLRHGYSGASMDRIASSLGMSKRTVYQVFPSKEALFREVMDSFIASTLTIVDGLVKDKSLGFEEKIQRLMEMVGTQLTRICQPLVEDMRVLFPDIWQKVHAMRARIIDEYWGRLVREGRRKGVFRKDVDHRLVVLMLVSSMQGIMTPEVLAEQDFSAAGAFTGIMQVLMQGIVVSEKRSLG